jgi:hypothetical protein
MMAFSNPKVYFDELLEPMFRRFSDEPTSYELAISTCIIAYHFSDVVAHVRKITVKTAVEMISAKIPAFETISALANAGKHVELMRHENKALIGLRAEDLKRGKGSAFSDGTYYSDGTTHSDARETIVVVTPDDRKHDILHVCEEVVAGISRHPEFFQT